MWFRPSPRQEDEEPRYHQVPNSSFFLREKRELELVYIEVLPSRQTIVPVIHS
jgi:hypothetical protein